jgi:hypothetical protein
VAAFIVVAMFPSGERTTRRQEDLWSMGSTELSESPGKFITLDPSDYWFGIDQHKDKLKKGLDVKPFVIPCFDANVNYQKEPIRFTYPVKCK